MGVERTRIFSFGVQCWEKSPASSYLRPGRKGMSDSAAMADFEM